MENIEVKVTSGEYVDETGLVQAVLGSNCEVKLRDGAQVIQSVCVCVWVVCVFVCVCVAQ